MGAAADGLGLRERKRLATRREIQRAVLTLCATRGLDKVTIDEISRAAEISPRTFFNYFASKDSALVGDELELACEADIERFVAGGRGVGAGASGTSGTGAAAPATDGAGTAASAADGVGTAASVTDGTGVTAASATGVMADLADLIGRSLANTDGDREIHELRRAVMKDNSYLFTMRMATLRNFEAGLQQIVERRFAADDPHLAEDPRALAQRALLVTLIAMAATRHAWRCWAEADDCSPLSAWVAKSFRELYTVTSATD